MNEFSNVAAVCASCIVERFLNKTWYVFCIFGAMLFCLFVAVFAKKLNFSELGKDSILCDLKK